MGIKVCFYSVILDGDVKFGRAANGYDTASFIVRKGNEKYRMILFSDNNEQNPFTRLKSCVEKGFLVKGKPIWLEAEMSYYEKSIIPDQVWEKLKTKLPEQLLEDIFGSTENPSKGKFPRFKVTDWDFSIPREAVDEKDKKTEAVKNDAADQLKPLINLSKWG